ncbi:MAG: molybdopterin-dependent oxidoreductase [Candidatus Bathyarchaeia archaeon]
MESERVRNIIEKLRARHSGEEVKYSGCYPMCHGGGCVLKLRIKNGKIICVEPDDCYNKNIAREDEVLKDIDFVKQRLQQRPCEVAYAWPEIIYHPQRILYPLKRVDWSHENPSPQNRGKSGFIRISWDEAINIIATEIKRCMEGYDE